MKSRDLIGLSLLSLIFFTGCKGGNDEPSEIFKATASASAVKDDESGLYEVNFGGPHRESICSLFKKALPSEVYDCDFSLDGLGVSIRLQSGDLWPVNNIYSEQEFLPTKGRVQGGSELNAGANGWSNFGALFVVQPVVDLCLSIDAFALDGQSDSVYFMESRMEDKVVVAMKIDDRVRKNKTSDVRFDANSVTIFAILPREKKTQIQKLIFEQCSS